MAKQNARTDGKLREAAPGETAQAVYTREQLAASERFANRKDLIFALLGPGETCTLAQAEAMAEKTLKGKVK